MKEDPLHQKLRILEVTFHNSYKARIMVTDAPDGSYQIAPGRTINVWHYEISADGKRITLTSQPTNSIKVLGEHDEELAHETITDWPLVVD